MLCKTVLSLCVSFVVFLCVLCFLVQCFTLLRFDVLSEGLMEFLDHTLLLCCVLFVLSFCFVVLSSVVFCCVVLSEGLVECSITLVSGSIVSTVRGQC